MQRIVSILIASYLLLMASAGTALSLDLQFPLDASVHDTSELAVVPHEVPTPFGSYLAMTIPFAPVEALYNAVQTGTGQTLITRGEAHITVITPVEFFASLKDHLSIQEIGAIAAAASMQAAPFDVVCLGRGDKDLEGEQHFTYFVVVDAPALFELRRAVHRAFVDAGGAPEAFDPERFYPHVTVGYTQRDLHLEDGVVKDRTSCFADLVQP